MTDKPASPRLSLCMIVRDEAFFIQACLEAARPFVDEVVVVDTGSLDETRDLARPFADRLLSYTWQDDFSAARNFSLEAATGDWILVLDADELIDPDGYQQIRRLMLDDSIDGYMLIHHNYSDEYVTHRQAVPEGAAYARGYRWVSHVPIMRLFRNRADIRFRGRIHEEVDTSIPRGRAGQTDLPIHHYLYANPHRPRDARVRRYLQMMEEELAVRPDGRLYGIAGSSALHVTREFEKAVDYLSRAAQLGYEKDKSLEGAAYACYLGKRFDDARDRYQDLYDRGIRSSAICLNLANLWVRAGRSDRAIPLLRESLAFGDLPPATAQALRGNLAYLEAQRGSAS